MAIEKISREIDFKIRGAKGPPLYSVNIIYISILLLFVINLSIRPVRAQDGGPDSHAEQKSEGVIFRFRFEKDDVFIVDKYQDIRSNAGASTSREEKNKITLHVVERTADASRMEGSFLTYSRSPRLVGEFRQDRTFDSNFLHADSGRYDVPANFVMPNLRGLPTFPDRALKPGDTWSANALETMDIDSAHIEIPIHVTYRYEGVEEIKDREGHVHNAHKIKYSYSFDQRVRQTGTPIVRITGRSADTLWFDLEEGIPVYDRNRIDYVFYAGLNTGRYGYDIESWYKKIRHAQPEERNTMEKDITSNLPANSDITVRQTDQGVALNLNDILFDFDSARLTPHAEKEMETIADILKRYPDREIRISGHTDSVGDNRYNQTLSENRARAVTRMLQNRFGLDSRRISYRGFGEEQPLAPNTTREGRAKNRRVEVLIVTE